MPAARSISPAPIARLAGRLDAARWALVGIIAAGVLMRLYRFGEPILDQHAFRQTQTASTVWLWQRDGLDVLSYHVPMFGGGHWVLEFPSYQLVVWAFSAPFGVGAIEPVGRLVSLGAYVASSVLIYLLCRRFVGSRSAGLFAVAVFAALPITVFYFRAVMIDPLLIALALLAIYAAARLHERFTWVWFAVLAASGLLALLGKASLMLQLALPLFTLAVRMLLDRRLSLVRKASLVALGVVGLVLTLLWVRHADDLNIPDGALSFGDGKDWYFGTTFTDPGLFQIVGQRFLDNLGPIGMLLVAVGLASIAGLRTGYRIEVAAMVVGVAVSVPVFANLNRVHDYYQLAYYVPLAMLAGLGLHTAYRVVAAVSLPGARRLAGGTLVALVALWSLTTWTTYFGPAAVGYGLELQGQELRDHTPDTRLVVLAENADKNEPMLWYEARRTGWRVPTSDPDQAAAILRRAPDVGAVVFIKGQAPEPAFISGLARRAGFTRTYDGPGMVVYS
ncbi:MAG: ArnT family glycosyltransferase [Thermoleophilia bacterium]